MYVVCRRKIDVTSLREIARKIKCRTVVLCEREVIYEAERQVRLLERHVSHVATGSRYEYEGVV